MVEKLPKEIVCILPIMKYFLPQNTTLPECQNNKSEEDVTKALINYVYDIVDVPESIGCPLPCRQINYKMNLDLFHKNSWTSFNSTISKNERYFNLEYRYMTLFVDEKIESLEYDIGSFLAAAGGNLGLMLGFSCLSVLFATVEYANKYLSTK